MKDFCDGRQFRSHHQLSVCTNALQLLFYYNDVEVCNPLGSSRTKHTKLVSCLTMMFLKPYVIADL